MKLEQNILDLIKTKSNYKIGIYADDMKGHIFSYNSSNTFETASTIKSFIVMCLYHEIINNNIDENELITYQGKEKISGPGILKLSEPGLIMSIKNYAIFMIGLSDNVATNIIIDKIGGVMRINDVLKENGFNKTKLLNKIALDLGIYKLGITTPFEYGKLYKDIYEGKIYNKEISNEIYSILKKQQDRWITKYLPKEIALNIGKKDNVIKSIAVKGGSLSLSKYGYDNVVNDGGIIETIFGSYIITIFISGFDDEYITYDNEAVILLGRISEIVYNNFISNKGYFN